MLEQSAFLKRTKRTDELQALFRTQCTKVLRDKRSMNAPKDRLKELRISAGFETVADAARALKINQNTLTSHENGNREISRKAAVKYAAAFGRSAGYILYGESQAPDIDDAQLDQDMQDFMSLDPEDRRRLRAMIRGLLASSDE